MILGGDFNADPFDLELNAYYGIGGGNGPFTATVSVPPGARRVEVVTVDRAGNRSEPTRYQLPA